MAYQDINTSGWKENVSYQKYDPVYFKRSLVDYFTIGNFSNKWTQETGNWYATNSVNDVPPNTEHDFYGHSFKTNDVPFHTHITGDHILSSPKFKINPLSNYKASVFIAKKDENVTTENRYKKDILDNGAGLRISFYDAAGSRIYAGVNLVETHKLVEVNKISTTGWQNIHLELPYRAIPQFGNVAVSGSLDLVVYGQKRGPVYFSGAKIYNTDQYHYATEDHTSSNSNSPTGTNSKWTQKFQHNASYNSSVSFRSNNANSVYGDGYYRLIQKGTNALQMQANLSFEARTDEEAESILHFLKNKQGYNPFFFTMADPYNKELPYFCEEYNHVKNFTNNNTISATFVNDVETVFTKANIILSESIAKNRYLDWTPQKYSVNEVAFYEKLTNVSGVPAQYGYNFGPTSDVYATGDENYYYKKSNLPNVESVVNQPAHWVYIPDGDIGWIYSHDDTYTLTNGWFYQHNSGGRWIYAQSGPGDISFYIEAGASDWKLVYKNIVNFWNTGTKTFAGASEASGIKSDESLVPSLNDNWTKDFFFWKPSLGLQIQKRPRIVKSNIKDKFTLRAEDGLNEDLLTLDASFNNRSDKETSSILHFLEQKRGYKSFKFLPPEPYGQKIVYTGINTVITGDRSLYNTITAGDDILFTDISGGYVDVERKIKSVELVSGDLDYNFDHGITKITLNKHLPAYYDVPAVGTPSGENRFVVLKNFICSEWNHNYLFDDNNSITAKLVETPFKWRAPPDLLIDGDIFVEDGSPIDYTIKAKDREGITKYRFYNVDSTVPVWSQTGVADFSETEPITFTNSGVNILRLEAENSLGIRNSVDYEVVVGGDISAGISFVNGSEYVERSGSLGVFFSAGSSKFISGSKFWWSDESEPSDYTPVKWNNHKITTYNSRFSGVTDLYDNTFRYFNDGAGHGNFTIYFKAIDFEGNVASTSAPVYVLQDENIARIDFQDSENGNYFFNQRYYSGSNYSNKNFLNSGNLHAAVIPKNITGDIKYKWTHKSTTYSDSSKVIATRHQPVGENGISGNYFNVTSKLLTSYPDEDTFAEVEMECLVTGEKNGSIITGKRDVTFAFSWLVD